MWFFVTNFELKIQWFHLNFAFLIKSLPKCVPASLFFAQAYIGIGGIFSLTVFFFFSCLLGLEIPSSLREFLFLPYSMLQIFSTQLLLNFLCSGLRTYKLGLFNLSPISVWRVSNQAKPSLIVVCSQWRKRLPKGSQSDQEPSCRQLLSAPQG